VPGPSCTIPAPIVDLAEIIHAHLRWRSAISTFPTTRDWKNNVIDGPLLHDTGGALRLIFSRMRTVVHLRAPVSPPSLLPPVRGAG